MTVRQVVTVWPACAPFLDRFAGSRWGGRWTLQELSAFARDHGLDEPSFLSELARVAGVPIERHARTPREGSPVSIIFVAVAVGLTLGAGWGVLLLWRIAFGADYGAAPAGSVHVHGLAQLWGWVCLFVFAVAGHLLRQNSRQPAPKWLESMAAAVVLAALLAFFAALGGWSRGTAARIEVIASALLVVAVLLFSVSVLGSLLGRRQRPQLWHYFVFAMVAWLWVWAGADLLLRFRYLTLSILPDQVRSLLILLPVLGFATNAIYGFGIRLIPGLLNIGRLRPRCFAAALAMHNLGLVLLLSGQRALQATGATLMLAAGGMYLIGMNGLRIKPSRPIYGIDTRGHILIRVAFFWLICGLAMILVQQFFPGVPHAYSGAWRHALTVGFITTMILGVGQRIVPVFIKQPLASTRLMLVGAALIVVGNAGRVGLELATLGNWPWTFRLMGVTGLLELSALILFGLNLGWTARNRRRVYGAGEPLAADTRVREAVNAWPELQLRLHELGVTMLDAAPFIAPSMTFGALALAWGRQPEELLDQLGPGFSGTFSPDYSGGSLT
jgi:hypothetical protein